jgi:protein SCO1/2
MRRVTLLALSAALACAGEPPARLGDLKGPRLETPLPRPGFVLENLDGTPFHFREATQGRLTFLFFGYINCPDVCPLHMANLASALRELPEAQRRAVQVIFVTTDPERDTPERLREWVSRFDSGFVALRGSPLALETAQRSLAMPPAWREGELAGGRGYAIAHATQLWAFTADDSAHVMYPWGITRDVLAEDLAILVRVRPAR